MWVWQWSGGRAFRRVPLDSGSWCQVAGIVPEVVELEQAGRAGDVAVVEGQGLQTGQLNQEPDVGRLRT